MLSQDGSPRLNLRLKSWAKHHPLVSPLLTVRRFLGYVVKIRKPAPLPESAPAIIADLAYQRDSHSFPAIRIGSSVCDYGRVHTIRAEVAGICLLRLIVAMNAEPRDF